MWVAATGLKEIVRTVETVAGAVDGPVVAGAIVDAAGRVGEDTGRGM
jgi:hypothetical protein